MVIINRARNNCLFHCDHDDNHSSMLIFYDKKEIDYIVFEWIVMYFVYFSKMSSFKFTFCVIAALLTIAAVVNSQSKLKLTIISTVKVG